MPTKYLPLKSIPFSIQLEDVTVDGEIVVLLPNDMVVEVTSPVSGRWRPGHIPHFAMGNRESWYATVEGWQTTGLTQYGMRRACELLRELYERNKNDAAFAPPMPRAETYYAQTAKPSTNQRPDRSH